MYLSPYRLGQGQGGGGELLTPITPKGWRAEGSPPCTVAAVEGELLGVARMATARSSLLQEAEAESAGGEKQTTPTGWGAEGSPPGLVAGEQGGLLKVAGASAAESTLLQDAGREESPAVPGKARQLAEEEAIKEGGGAPGEGNSETSDGQENYATMVKGKAVKLVSQEGVIKEHGDQGNFSKQARRTRDEERTEPRRNIEVREGDWECKSVSSI